MTPTPNFIRRATATVLGLALAAGLAGCVSLFPKEKPAQLYRFTPQMQGPSASMDAQRIPISLSPVEFTAAASGDRMLTMTGDEAAYIEGARWVSPFARLGRKAGAPTGSSVTRVPLRVLETR